MTAGSGGEPSLQHLWDDGSRPANRRGAPMPRALRRRYGGGLEVGLRDDRPTVIVNFVTTLDGIVALGPEDQSGGGPISGFFEPDRFVMALLRSLADALLMGAGTIAGSSSHQWTAGHLAPAHAAELARWRRSLGLAPHPTVVIVTGSGKVRLGRRALDDPSIPVVFATTRGGARQLRMSDLPAHARIEVVGSGSRISPEALATFLATLDARLVLCEGGPHLLGDLVSADAVDELFLTVAPQVIGRGAEGRRGLVEGFALSAADARWFELASAKRSGDHLFLRHRRREHGTGGQT